MEDALLAEIEALREQPRSAGVVQSLKDAAIAFLKRAKPLLKAADASAADDSATASTAAAAEPADAPTSGSAADAPLRAELAQIEARLAAYEREEAEWSALEREEFSAADAASAERAARAGAAGASAFDSEADARRYVAERSLSADEARRAFEDVALHLDGVLPGTRDLADAVARLERVQAALAEQVRSITFAPYEAAGDARTLISSLAKD